MDTSPEPLLHHLAQSYLLFLADFSADLKPAHLDVPAGEQEIAFAGLQALRGAIGSIYQYFTRLEPTGERWTDREFRYRAVEAPVRLLWALGASGKLARGPHEIVLLARRADLDAAMKLRSVQNPAAAFDVLEEVGFVLDYRGEEGKARPSGYKKCASVALGYPANNEPLLCALGAFAARLPVVKNGLPFEIFLRADFRPFLPGYAMQIPHLPAEEDEVTRMLEPATLELWREMSRFVAANYPKCRAHFRTPRIRNRGWFTDYSPSDKDYGLWSSSAAEDGFRVRLVLKQKGYHYLLEHIDELSPRFQEIFLSGIHCRDCIHCGKDFIYQHGDHTHRLCKGPWFYSPALSMADMLDVERLIAIHLAHLN